MTILILLAGATRNHEVAGVEEIERLVKGLKDRRQPGPSRLVDSTEILVSTVEQWIVAGNHRVAGKPELRKFPITRGELQMGAEEMVRANCPCLLDLCRQPVRNCGSKLSLDLRGVVYRGVCCIKIVVDNQQGEDWQVPPLTGYRSQPKPEDERRHDRETDRHCELALRGGEESGLEPLPVWKHGENLFQQIPT